MEHGLNGRWRWWSLAILAIVRGGRRFGTRPPASTMTLWSFCRVLAVILRKQENCHRNELVNQINIRQKKPTVDNNRNMLDFTKCFFFPFNAHLSLSILCLTVMFEPKFIRDHILLRNIQQLKGTKGKGRGKDVGGDYGHENGWHEQTQLSVFWLFCVSAVRRFGWSCHGWPYQIICDVHDFINP